MRSSWKVPFIAKTFFKKHFLKKKSFKVKLRNSMIPLAFIDKRIEVYNGKDYRSLNITNNKVGFRFGEFSLTKTAAKYVHLKKNKRKTQKKLKK